jgi:hypothetical protein
MLSRRRRVSIPRYLTSHNGQRTHVPRSPVNVPTRFQCQSICTFHGSQNLGARLTVAAMVCTEAVNLLNALEIQHNKL